MRAVGFEPSHPCCLHRGDRTRSRSRRDSNPQAIDPQEGSWISPGGMLVLWPASDESGFVSGSVFTIDGRLTAGSPIVS